MCEIFYLRKVNCRIHIDESTLVVKPCKQSIKTNTLLLIINKYRKVKVNKRVMVWQSASPAGIYGKTLTEI